MKAAHPYLNFDGNAEEAFAFYQSVFGGELLPVVRFRDMGGTEMGMPEGELDLVAHISLPIATHTILMGSDVPASLGYSVSAGNNTYINLEVESVEEAERVFTALADGGKTEMSLASTEWAERFGSCSDKFGVQWMVNYEGDARSNQAQSR